MARKPRLHPIRARRQALGLSGVALARRAGISVSHLHEIETGKTALPRVDFALALADELSLDVRELFPRSRAA